MIVRNPNQRAPATTRPLMSPTAMVAKSVVCVALVAGLAWIGVWSINDTAATDDTASDVAARLVMSGDRAAAHRRAVFEERRARLEARAPTQIAGGPQ